jgi:hypothetical protein
MEVSVREIIRSIKNDMNVKFDMLEQILNMNTTSSKPTSAYNELYEVVNQQTDEIDSIKSMMYRLNDAILNMQKKIDSMYKDNPGAMPPFMKKGNYFLTTVKLLDVFKNQTQMETARKKDMQLKMEKDSIENIKILVKEDKELQAYFKKNNIVVHGIFTYEGRTVFLFIQYLISGLDFFIYIPSKFYKKRFNF